MDYAEISWNSTTRVTVIQVTGCAKQTSVEIPTDIVYGTDDYSALLESVAQSVLANMNPLSPTYDASLVTP